MAAANEPDPVAAQPAFTERLLFVNHDAKNMKSRPFREKVFSHIQFNFHRWRRSQERKGSVKPSSTEATPPPPPTRAKRRERASHQDNNKVQASTTESVSGSSQAPSNTTTPSPASGSVPSTSLTPSPDCQSPPADSVTSTSITGLTPSLHGHSADESQSTRASSAATESSWRSPDSNSDVPSGRKSSVTSATTSDLDAIDSSNMRAKDYEHAAQVFARFFQQGTDTAASPQSLVQRGNSDPFNAFPVPVNPAVNGLIVFGRDCLMPALYFQSSGTYAPSIKGWSANSNAAEDVASAWALLAYYSTTLSIISGHDSHGTRPVRQSLVYRTKCSEALREQLAEKNAFMMPTTYAMIYKAFRTETVARNQVGAEVHGRMLRKLLEGASQKMDLDTGFLSLVLYHDTMRAISFMSRPIFDMEMWVPKVFGQAWAHEPPGPRPPVSPYLDPSVSEPPLRALALAARQFYEMCCLAYCSGKVLYELTAANWFWFVSYTEYYSARFLTCYLDLSERIDLTMDVVLQSTLSAQACICLGALYQFRSFRHDPIIGGVSLYEGNTNILRHLRMRLELIDQVSVYRQEISTRSVNARLFGLYVGATAEQTRRLKHLWKRHPSEDPMRDDWFTRQLVTLCDATNITSWAQLHAVLRGFVYSDYMAPHGSQWFDRMMTSAFPWTAVSTPASQTP